MKELVNVIARALVDRPDEVRVETHGAPVTVIALRVNPEDLGKIIGRQGRTAKSIRTLLAAAGSKQHKRFHARNRRRLVVPENPRFITVARLLKPRGNKGELAAQLLTDFPERLTKLKEVFLSDPKSKSEPRKVTVQNCWLSQNHKGQAVFHFENINSINDAEKLRGQDVLLPIEQRVTLPAGVYFVADLVGCSVFELASAPPLLASPPCAINESPALLGTVTDVEFPGEDFPGTPLLVVALASPQPPRESEILIPLAEDICTRIDTSARRIEVILPAGLRDLNAPE